MFFLRVSSGSLPISIPVFDVELLCHGWPSSSEQPHPFPMPADLVAKGKTWERSKLKLDQHRPTTSSGKRRNRIATCIENLLEQKKKLASLSHSFTMITY